MSVKQIKIQFVCRCLQVVEHKSSRTPMQSVQDI